MILMNIYVVIPSLQCRYLKAENRRFECEEVLSPVSSHGNQPSLTINNSRSRIIKRVGGYDVHHRGCAKGWNSRTVSVELEFACLSG